MAAVEIFLLKHAKCDNEISKQLIRILKKSFFPAGKYVFLKLEWNEKGLASRVVDPNGAYTTPAWLERVIVYGLASKPHRITLRTKKEKRSVLSIPEIPGNQFPTSRVVKETGDPSGILQTVG